MDPRVHLFGIRHHGPGSARSLRLALDALQPDALLVEGPPDANAMLPLALHEDMRPPVALLIYAPDQPTAAAYYPFADYSPEWQAIRYALSSDIPLAMMDLPQSIQMGMAQSAMEEAKRRADQPPPAEELPQPVEGDTSEETSQPPTPAFDTADPLRMLAEAAGYSESEQWWEHMVEQRREGESIFAAILEAMTALREEAPQEANPIAIRREAAMRQTIRATLKEGYQRIAVVCGAWHAPALTRLEGAGEDSALLRGLPKIKVQATWVPWTHARLTRLSGYGAGIESPGWYAHLWENDGTDRSEIAARWMIRVARLLREEDLDISPAHTIEAVRLAESLAALRDRPLPGLPEMNEAALTVFCFGNPLPMQLIAEKLIVGDALGSVPSETPMAPLQQDFERETRRLRMPPEAGEKPLDLDLRKPIDLERSHLLHRLNLLGIPWGKAPGAALQAAGHGRSGTFHEAWSLRWQPEFSVLLIEAGQWGNRIESAASSRVCQAARKAPDLAALTELVEDVLLAELPDAISEVMHALQAQAAVSSDTRHLMHALPPLASVLRYGNVRQTDTAMIAEVVDGLAARVCIGLPGACASLNDEAADEMFELLMKVNEAFSRLDEARYREDWQHALALLLDLPNIHGLLAGRACRILLDSGTLSDKGDHHGEASRRLGLALSTAVDPVQAAAWMEGFLRNSGQILIHDEALLAVIDGWLSTLPDGIFVQLLPLLRRTFSTFAFPERRSIGERVKRGVTGAASHLAAPDSAPGDFDQTRADAVLPLVSMLLGLNEPLDRQGAYDRNASPSGR